MIVSACYRSAAQEWSIGAHLNPTFSFPILSGESIYDPELRFSPLKPGYSAGFNVSFTSGRMGVESGASIIAKNHTVRQSDFNTPSETGITAKSSFDATSLEVPVLLTYRVREHSGRTAYSTHLLLGASYEWANPRVVPAEQLRDSAASRDYRVSILSTPLPDHADLSWPNLLAGAQIRAVLRGAGLIEYGFAVHVPLEATGPYGVQTTVTEFGQTTSSFRGKFYPRLAYFDLRLRYFFLNFKKGEGRVRYRT